MSFSPRAFLTVVTLLFTAHSPLVPDHALLAADPADDLTPAAQLVQADRVLVIAHRGDSKVAPENTLPAFQSAVDIGADLIELDYGHTSDGVPIVIHDGTLDRTTDARVKLGGQQIRVVDKTAAELADLDAGTWFGEQFAGTRVPTLAEALDVIQAGSVTLIEQKAGDAETLVNLLREKDLTDKVVVQSFNWGFLTQVHQLEPRIVLGALGHQKLTTQKLDAAQQTGAQVIGWSHNSVTKEWIDEIHRRGLKAWVWTVDDMDRAEHLIGEGIDGVITNVPAQVQKLVPQRAAAASPAVTGLPVVGVTPVIAP